MDTELPLAINYKGIVKIVAIIALALPTLVLFWRTALVPLLVGSQLLSVSFAVIYSIAGAYYFAAARYTWYLAAGLNRFPGLSSGIWCLGMNCIVVTIALVFNGLVAERKLCFVSLYSYLFVLIYIGSQCCNTWLEEKDKDLTHFLAPLSSQLLCLSTVWIWYWYSKDLRSMLSNSGQIGDGDTTCGLLLTGVLAMGVLLRRRAAAVAGVLRHVPEKVLLTVEGVFGVTMELGVVLTAYFGVADRAKAEQYYRKVFPHQLKLLPSDQPAVYYVPSINPIFSYYIGLLCFLICVLVLEIMFSIYAFIHALNTYWVSATCIAFNAKYKQYFFQRFVPKFLRPIDESPALHPRLLTQSVAAVTRH
ncbi:unnamed protein product, partial [Mesorhabditis spiculigera]